MSAPVVLSDTNEFRVLVAQLYEGGVQLTAVPLGTSGDVGRVFLQPAELKRLWEAWNGQAIPHP